MRTIKLNSIYKHFKGNLYLVENIAIDSDTLQELVIYKGLYGTCPLYVRKLEDFLSEVDKKKYPNVKQKYRFEEVNGKDN